MRALVILVVATTLAACGGGNTTMVPQTAGFSSAMSVVDVATKYNCSTSLGAKTLPVSIVGRTPATVAPGAAVSMTGFQATVTIPAGLVNTLISDGASSLSITATVLDVKATDAKVATVNGARKPLSYGPVTLKSNTAVKAKFPGAPTTIGEWVGLNEGTMTFTPGAASFTINASPFTITASCKGSSAEISSTTVS